MDGIIVIYNYLSRLSCGKHPQEKSADPSIKKIGQESPKKGQKFSVFRKFLEGGIFLMVLRGISLQAVSHIKTIYKQKISEKRRLKY